MTAREVVLGRVRAALADIPPDDEVVVPDVPPRAPATPPAQRFVERAAEYRARVHAVPGGADAVRAAVRDICAHHGVRALAVPPGLDPAWLPPGVTAHVDDPPLPIAELDAIGAALTGSALAIAETGTIALDGGPDQGRRALTLVCDLHVCVVDAARIVGSLGHALPLLGAGVRDDRRPITFVSGPSATSDIEMRRVEGVHGPRRLEIVVCGAPDSQNHTEEVDG